MVLISSLSESEGMHWTGNVAGGMKSRAPYATHLLELFWKRLSATGEPRSSFPLGCKHQLIEYLRRL